VLRARFIGSQDQNRQITTSRLPPQRLSTLSSFDNLFCYVTLFSGVPVFFFLEPFEPFSSIAQTRLGTLGTLDLHLGLIFSAVIFLRILLNPREEMVFFMSHHLVCLQKCAKSYGRNQYLNLLARIPLLSYQEWSHYIRIHLSSESIEDCYMTFMRSISQPMTRTAPTTAPVAYIPLHHILGVS